MQKQGGTNYLILCIIIIILGLLAGNCEEEKAQPREYPRVNTLPVTNITEEGATFNADLYSLGSEKITEFGFVWGTSPDLSLLNDRVVLPGAQVSTGIYSADIKSALSEGVEYTVKSYVSTEGHVVYGKPLTFVSLGSMGPIITGFKPDTVIWGDTLKIIGKNFSLVPSNNKVRLNQTECEVISSIDTALIVLVNGNLTDIKSKISVELAGNSSVYDQKELVLKMPQILKIDPLQVNWGDTVTVSGKFLNTGSNRFSVTVSGFTGKIIAFKKDTILITVPYELITISNELKIKINSTDFTAPELLTLIPPTITNITPPEGRWSDAISVSGNNLNTGRNKFTVTINGIICNILEYKADTLVLEVPYDLASVTSEVKIKVNNMTLIAPVSFTLMAPYITGIIPKEGTWGTVVTVKGRFHPAKTRNNITIGGSSADIISNNMDSIRVRVNFGVTNHDNPVRDISPPFNILSPDTFRLYGPDIQTVTPLSGPVGTDIKIRGKYLKGQYSYQTLVHIGTEEVSPLSVSDSVLSGKIPFGVSNGPNKVKVTRLNQSSVFNNDFIVTNPVISKIYPLTGTYDDEITIEGENFLFNGFSTYVIFNNSYTAIEAEIVEHSYTRLVAKVPRGIDSIPLNISVSLGYVTTTFPQPFILNPPEITGVSSSVLIPGQDITISGNNFNPLPSGNQVFWGAYNIPIKSSTTTEIIASVPLYLSRGLYNLSIKTAGYKRSYPFPYEITSSWKGISLISAYNWFSGSSFGQSGVSFSTGNIGYMIDPLNGQMISYNPSSGVFTDLGVHQTGRGLSGTVNLDTLYLMGSNFGISRYDNISNTWINICSVPVSDRHGICFSLNGKLYFGLTYTNYSQTLNNGFWVFDSKLKTWVTKNNFPGYSEQFAASCFTINNKGYVLFADKVFCEYNPASDTWTQLTSFPGPGSYRFGMVSFVIDNIAYIGLGADFYASETNQYDDFWIYNPQTGSWSESTHMPWGARYNSISFVVNNKSYVGFGYKSDIEQKDLFEFDPNYPLK